MTGLIDTTAAPDSAVHLVARRRQPLILALVFGLVAAVYVNIGSWIPSLWGDEAASLLSAKRPLATLLPMLMHLDAVHGTYYLGLHFWVDVFGPSAYAIRVPSALAAGFAVAGLVVLAHRMSGTRVAIVAGVIGLTLPRITYMGEEARSYAFAAALVTWLTFLLIQLLSGRVSTRRWWVLYGVGLAFGTYLFLYVALFALVHAVIVWRSRPGREWVRRWVTVVCCSAVAASPFVLVAFFERGQIAYLYNNAQVTFSSIFTALWFSYLPFAVLAWALIAVAVGAALFAWRAKVRQEAGDAAGRTAAGGVPAGADSDPGVGGLGVDRATPVGTATRLPGLTFVALTWLLLPSLVLIGTQYIYRDFTGRYLTYCAPAAALLMALGLCALARRHTAIIVAGLVLIVAMGVPAYLVQRGPYSMNGSDWAELSTMMAKHAHRGDAIVFDEKATPSRRPRLAEYTYPSGFTGLKDLTLETPYQHNDTWYDRTYTMQQTYDLGRFAGQNRVWLIEYARGSHADTWGLSDMVRFGYHETAHYRAYSAVVYLFQR